MPKTGGGYVGREQHRTERRLSCEAPERHRPEGIPDREKLNITAVPASTQYRRDQRNDAPLDPAAAAGSWTTAALAITNKPPTMRQPVGSRQHEVGDDVGEEH
jgi:hypothetical protein